jgi:hypothetical protein
VLRICVVNLEITNVNNMPAPHRRRIGCNVTARNGQIPFSSHGIIGGLPALEATFSLMCRRLVRKFGSLIGLLAILMTALAPSVSQALASGTQTDTIFSAFCSAAPQSSTEKHKPSQHSVAGHWDACGYCNFAAHSPAAPPSAVALPTRVSTTSLPVNARAQAITPHAPVFAAQPRAPPFPV